MRDFPRKAWLYTLLVAGSASALTFTLSGRSANSFGSVLGFAVLIVAAEAVPVELPHVSYSVGFVVVLAAIIAIGPEAAAIVASFGALDLDLRRRSDWLGRLVFNAAQLCLSAGLSGLVYHVAHGPVGSLTGHNFARALLPIALATSAYFLSNLLLVAGMVRLVRRVPWRDLWHSNYRAACLSYFSFAVLGVLLALLFLNIGWGASFFLLLPLLVARNAFHSSAKLQQAFDATFRSLVTAIEAKDVYTRGHAERVSRLAEMVAREYGLPESRARQVRYAALMHDVGKLTVDTRVLQKPGKLTAEEFEHMKVHPIRGAEIVSEIDLLAGMVDGVRHHHERMDGRGYPDGLEGDQLSQAARMIMVSDAFDSMTSTRSYRRAMPITNAFDELRRCAGTQFDAAMIDVLERAVTKRGWDPSPESFEGEQTPRPAVSVHAISG